MVGRHDEPQVCGKRGAHQALASLGECDHSAILAPSVLACVDRFFATAQFRTSGKTHFLAHFVSGGGGRAEWLLIDDCLSAGKH